MYRPWRLLTQRARILPASTKETFDNSLESSTLPLRATSNPSQSMLAVNKGQKRRLEVKRESESPAPVQTQLGTDASGSEQDNEANSDVEPAPKRQAIVQTLDENTAMYDAQPAHPSDQVMVEPSKGQPASQSSWAAVRLELINRASPVVSFRAEQIFKCHNLAYTFENQSAVGTMVMTIRTIGSVPNVLMISLHTTLLRALEGIGITPVLLQKQLLQPKKSNDWIAILQAEESLRLPAYSSSSKGLFGTKTSQNFVAFLWKVPPLNAAEAGRSSHWFLRLEAHIPVIGPPTEHLADRIKKGFSLVDENGENPEPLNILVAQFQGIEGTAGNGKAVRDGTLIFEITDPPSTGRFMTFWRNPSTGFLNGMWKNTEIRLQLMDTCVTCGVKSHKGHHCEYGLVLEDMKRNNLKILSTRAITINNEDCYVE
ncbi:uncharacterized protein VP01_18g6 [Puccinia sorghi]|uniref:Uncharacterized protein n=1 Tax=Puccinia sorghi TaxID=27349 RepID=A0A0L6VEQ7_9BASI|nr:uncharacterized protein VP01_18g6 [Puccinia sorghi]